MQLQQEKLREIQPRAANCWMVSTFLGEVGEWKVLSSLCSLLRSSIFFFFLPRTCSVLGFSPTQTMKKEYIKNKKAQNPHTSKQKYPNKSQTWASLLDRNISSTHITNKKCSVTLVPFGLSELMRLPTSALQRKIHLFPLFWRHFTAGSAPVALEPRPLLVLALAFFSLKTETRG